MRVIYIEGNASSMMKSGAPLHLFRDRFKFCVNIKN